MTITVPDQPPDIPTGNLATGEDAEAGDFETVAEAQQWLYSRASWRVPGHVWTPALQTTSTSLTTEPDGDPKRPLDAWHPSARMQRRPDGSVHFVTWVHIEHMRVECNWVRINSSSSPTVIDSEAATQGAGAAWITISTTVGESNVFDGGNTSNSLAPIRIELGMEVDSDGNTGEMYAAAARGKVLDAADMP